MAEPSIKFGTASVWGTQTGWAALNPSSSVVSTRANALGSTGNEVASKLHDERTDTSQEFVASSATVAPTIAASIGKLVDSKVLTSISISTSSSDFVKQTLAGHNHTDNAHEDTLQQAAHGISLSKAFGAIDFLGGTAGDDASIDSSTLTISCQHVDTMDADGDHLIGNNYDARAVATVTWHGVPTTAAGAGWDVTSVQTTEESTGFLKTVVEAEKTIAIAPPTPPEE
jgi:hypothetical protein